MSAQSWRNGKGLWARDFVCGSLAEATVICVREAMRSEERSLAPPDSRVVPIRADIASVETNDTLDPR